MRSRLRSAVAIPWLLMAVVAVGHGQERSDVGQAPDGQGPMWGSDVVIGIEAVKVPSGEVTEGGDVRSTPAWMTYSFFFKHLENLERAADKQAALGNESSAAAWRTHEQLAAGLDASEARVLKEVAHDCIQAVEAKDEKIQALAAALHTQRAGEALLAATTPPELDALWQERIEIIDQQIYRLRALLGEERFLALDSYIRANFTPVVIPSGSVKGGAR